MRCEAEGDPDYLDRSNRIWWAERLPIHEARTEADVWSSGKVIPAYLNLRLVRGQRKVNAA